MEFEDVRKDFYATLAEMSDMDVARHIVNAGSNESRFLIQAYLSSDPVKREKVQRILNANYASRGIFLED